MQLPWYELQHDLDSPFVEIVRMQMQVKAIRFTFACRCDIEL
jgi:hypothetical protein